MNNDEPNSNDQNAQAEPVASEAPPRLELPAELAELVSKPWECIQVAAEAKLDDAGRFGLICKGVADRLNYADNRIWTTSVSAAVKIERAARAKLARSAQSDKVRELLKRAKMNELPTFEVGDHAEVANKLTVHFMNMSGGTPLAYDLGFLHRYITETGLWTPIEDAELSNVIQGWSGAPIILFDRVEGILRVNNVTTPIQLATHKPAAWGQGEGFLSEAPKGIAFADGFIMVDEQGPIPVLEGQEHAPENRARVGFDFDFDPDAKCDMFHKYLNDIWGGAPDFEARCSLIQEFVGVALVGMAPRYKKALILHGHKGTGKSTFLQIVRGMFPGDALSEVSPLNWSDDGKLAALDKSRLNTVFELEPDHLKNQERVKEVIDGEKIQIREVYRRQTTIQPAGANLFAANKLFKAPGADPSFWDRWLVLDLFADRSFRGKKSENKNLAEQIIQAELPGLVAWALDGARRAFAQDGYTIPEVTTQALDTWKSEADVVAIWLHDKQEVSAWNDGTWEKASGLYKKFKTWLFENGHKQLSSFNFYTRLKDNGVINKRSNGSWYQVVLEVKPIFEE